MLLSLYIDVMFRYKLLEVSILFCNFDGMGNKATTLDQQIVLLRNRGVIITNEEKAKECLLDIGYYRLCSYLFPFEKTYPKYNNRTHEVVEGTQLRDAVALYYFDFDLRIILIRYITRIEVAIRTYITYSLSNKYAYSPTWFVDPLVMTSSYIKNFDEVYDSIKAKSVIKRHHKKYINDRYAPAWKTLEFMTFGNVEQLYINLKNPADKLDICRYFGINQTAIFENYLNTVRILRNACAHGSVLFDIRLPMSIKNGPAGRLARINGNNLCGALSVVEFFLERISINRLGDMRMEISDALNKLYGCNPNLELIVNEAAGVLQYKK